MGGRSGVARWFKSRRALFSPVFCAYLDRESGKLFLTRPCTSSLRPRVSQRHEISNGTYEAENSAHPAILAHDALAAPFCRALSGSLNTGTAIAVFRAHEALTLRSRSPRMRGHPASSPQAPVPRRTPARPFSHAIPRGHARRLIRGRPDFSRSPTLTGDRNRRFGHLSRRLGE